LACAHPGDRVDSPFVGGARRSTNGGPFVMQSDRKSRLITICMLASALVMIGLALTGTLQIRVSHSPLTRVVPNLLPLASLLKPPWGGTRRMPRRSALVVVGRSERA